MKRIGLVIMVVVFVCVSLISCNKSVCPAYVEKPSTEKQTDNSDV